MGGRLGRLGIEHEYRVLDGGGAAIDFRRWIARLVAGRRLDAADPNAVRCKWGGVITADGGEAEVATAPIRIRPGFVRRAGTCSRSAEAGLRCTLPLSWRLEGYSTHVSVSLAPDLGEEIAPLYARTFGPALMLLMDRPTSPGLLVRPRPGRLELCGEHVAGDALRAVVAFAAGSVLAIARGHYPSPIGVEVLAARERYGWYVDRRAFGSDLYALGRQARLHRSRRGAISAEAHLAESWHIARHALAGIARADDVAAADALVRGDLPLPLESAERHARPSVTTPRTVSAYGLATRTYTRPRFTAEPIAATWELAVFELHGRRTAYAAVPSEALAPVARLLRSGALDARIDAFLAAPPQGTTLTRAAADLAPGLYDAVVPLSELAPAEREPDAFAVAPAVTAPVPWSAVPAAVGVALLLMVLALRSLA